MSIDITQQKILIQHLQDYACFDHPVMQFKVIETHISWVLLTGRYAYKIKKAVDFGFLDYSSLEKRQHQCIEELRLNQRTAKDLYLEVIPIGGRVEHPQLHGTPAIEYMVKMRQFSQQQLLSRMLATGRLGPHHISRLAAMVANFHGNIEPSLMDSPYGTADAVYQPVAENFAQLRERIDDTGLLSRLHALEAANKTFFETHRNHFEQRKQDGFIRDCHGDLHLNNIIMTDDGPRLFDCIEFNDALRIIDVINEIAFLVMDLDEHKHQRQGNQCLNDYLTISGDYGGIKLLHFYLCYRAMVRAKVAVIGLSHLDPDDINQRDSFETFFAYLGLAERYANNNRPHIIIAHGLSGSGKTTYTSILMQETSAIRIRSDVERKRLFGLNAHDSSREKTGDGANPINIYTPAASRQTFQRLAEQAEAITLGGFPVIIDATFLSRKSRDQFRNLSEQLDCPFTILSFEASDETLIRRITQRCLEDRDASEADTQVLASQQAHFVPLDQDELAHTIIINTELSEPLTGVAEQLNQHGTHHNTDHYKNPDELDHATPINPAVWSPMT